MTAIGRLAKPTLAQDPSCRGGNLGSAIPEMHLSLLFLAATGPLLVVGDAPPFADGRPSSSNVFRCRRSRDERGPCEGERSLAHPLGSAEGARRGLLQRARSGFPERPQADSPTGEQLKTPLARDLRELYNVMMRTIFEGLIISGPISEKSQQEILEIMQSLLLRFPQPDMSNEKPLPSAGAPAAASYENEIRSSVSEMEKTFGWMREGLSAACLSQEDRAMMVELLSTLSLHQLMAASGHFGDLKLDGPRAIVMELGRLLDRLNLEARMALAVCNLAGEALTTPNSSTWRRGGPPVPESLTPREMIAQRIIKYLQELYQNESAENLSRLHVHNEWVEIAARPPVKSYLHSEAFSQSRIPWSTLIKYQAHFVDELRKVVDAGVDELQFQTKVFGQLGPWISRGCIADQIFLNRELRDRYDWLRVVLEGCQRHPEWEGCSELPGMVQFYREQRDRYLQACKEADRLSRKSLHCRDGILPVVKQFLPEIHLQQ